MLTIYKNCVRMSLAKLQMREDPFIYSYMHFLDQSCQIQAKRIGLALVILDVSLQRHPTHTADSAERIASWSVINMWLTIATAILAATLLTPTSTIHTNVSGYKLFDDAYKAIQVVATTTVAIITAGMEPNSGVESNVITF